MGVGGLVVLWQRKVCVLIKYAKSLKHDRYVHT